jgi:hypothetical protein
MAGSEADLLFSAKIGGSDALFYILWEHQRSEAPLMGQLPPNFGTLRRLRSR